MENFIEENTTQPNPQKLTQIIFWEQTMAWGGVVLILIAVMIAVWWVNHREDQ
jgi:hypothetical protein